MFFAALVVAGAFFVGPRGGGRPGGEAEEGVVGVFLSVGRGALMASRSPPLAGRGAAAAAAPRGLDGPPPAGPPRAGPPRAGPPRAGAGLPRAIPLGAGGGPLAPPLAGGEPLANPRGGAGGGLAAPVAIPGGGLGGPFFKPGGGGGGGMRSVYCCIFLLVCVVDRMIVN